MTTIHKNTVKILLRCISKAKTSIKSEGICSPDRDRKGPSLRSSGAAEFSGERELPSTTTDDEIIHSTAVSSAASNYLTACCTIGRKVEDRRIIDQVRMIVHAMYTVPYWTYIERNVHLGHQ
jgi:hypothetical protein